MKRIVMLLAAQALLAAAPAFAENMYVTGALGHTEQKLKQDGMTFSVSSLGISTAVGYRFTPHLAVEAGYAHFGEAAIRLDDDGWRLTARPKALYAALAGTVPLSSNLSLLAKLGAARNRTTVNVYSPVGTNGDVFKERDTSMMLGVGAVYAFSPAWSVAAEYQHFGKVVKGDEGERITAAMFSVGVRYSF